MVRVSWSILLALSVLSTGIGCSRQRVQRPVPVTASTADNSYIDLSAQWRLRIVLPILASGGLGVAASQEQSSGNTLTFRSNDLVGYAAEYYRIEDRGTRGVRLRFQSAEVTTNGKTTPQPHPTALPFQLPPRTEHVRLIYFVRASQADHNMAILAAKHVEALNAFSERLKKDPNACRMADEMFCSWVPAGVAVRPEQIRQ